jgi:acyl carrier protein
MTKDEVLELLVRRLRTVLALDEDVPADARFDEDLHADSLDLVEVVEGVERDLRGCGIAVHLPDDALVRLRTVGEAAAVIAAHAQ